MSKYRKHSPTEEPKAKGQPKKVMPPINDEILLALSLKFESPRGSAGGDLESGLFVQWIAHLRKLTAKRSALRPLPDDEKDAVCRDALRAWERVSISVATRIAIGDFDVIPTFIKEWELMRPRGPATAAKIRSEFDIPPEIVGAWMTKSPGLSNAQTALEDARLVAVIEWLQEKNPDRAPTMTEMLKLMNEWRKKAEKGEWKMSEISSRLKKWELSDLVSRSK